MKAWLEIVEGAGGHRGHAAKYAGADARCLVALRNSGRTSEAAYCFANVKS